MREREMLTMKQVHEMIGFNPRVKLGYCIDCERTREITEQSKCLNCGSGSVLIIQKKVTKNA